MRQNSLYANSHELEEVKMNLIETFQQNKNQKNAELNTTFFSGSIVNSPANFLNLFEPQNGVTIRIKGFGSKEAKTAIVSENMNKTDYFIKFYY